MRCQRCTALMVSERFLDHLDDTGKFAFYGWRCLICGEIMDPIILAHRKNKIRPIHSRNRKLIVGKKYFKLQ
jgi:hypothetical protein